MIRRPFYPTVLLCWLLALGVFHYGRQLWTAAQAFNEFDKPEVVAEAK